MQRILPLAFLIAIVGGSWLVLKPTAQVDTANGSASQPALQSSSAPAPNYPTTQGHAGYPSTRPTQAQTASTARRQTPPAPVTRPPATSRNASLPVAPAGGRPTIRIASYNIQVFGQSKAGKPYVMETLAAITRNFDVVAIQEIRTKDEQHMTRFLEYVNAGGQRRFDYIIGPRLGRSSSKEQYAFVYDTATIEVNRNFVYTVRDPDDLLHREPFVAMFRARGAPPEQAFTFVLVNIHTDPDETDTELNALGQVYQVVRQSSGGEDDIIVLGDLNVDDQNLGDLGRIPGVQPVISGVYSNTRQNKLYDNIVVHRPSSAEFTGRWGVYDVQRIHNLTLEQALQVSDHLPVWAEFDAYESTSPGRVATRPGVEAQ